MSTELEKLQNDEVELGKLDGQIKVLKEKQKFAIKAGSQNRYLTSINQLNIKRDIILASIENQFLKVEVETLTKQLDSLIKEDKKREAERLELKIGIYYLTKYYPERLNILTKTEKTEMLEYAKSGEEILQSALALIIN